MGPEATAFADLGLTAALVYFVVNDSRNKGRALTIMTRDYIQLLERAISAIERNNQEKNNG
jgi:hypothetical protein|tara:strand:- start:17348 stop:17530 length:183 start_codon:yes stop_codon:yes gene_type:complete